MRTEIPFYRADGEPCDWITPARMERLERLDLIQVVRSGSLRGRYRLQAVIQRIVECARLADFAARRLQARERFVNRLLEVVGGLRRPAYLFYPGRQE